MEKKNNCNDEQIDLQNVYNNNETDEDDDNQ